MKYKFDFNKFEESLKTINGVDDNERMAYHILETISPYIDCETNFFLSITEEQISIAMDLLHNNDSEKLKAMIIAEGVVSLTSNLKSIKKSTKEDLF